MRSSTTSPARDAGATSSRSPGATFAPLIHVTADWQLLEYRGAGRPLRRVLISGWAMGATVSDALQALVAQIRAAVAIEDAFDEL